MAFPRYIVALRVIDSVVSLCKLDEDECMSLHAHVVDGAYMHAIYDASARTWARAMLPANAPAPAPDREVFHWRGMVRHRRYENNSIRPTRVGASEIIRRYNTDCDDSLPMIICAYTDEKRRVIRDFTQKEFTHLVAKNVAPNVTRWLAGAVDPDPYRITIVKDDHRDAMIAGELAAMNADAPFVPADAANDEIAGADELDEGDDDNEGDD